MSNLTIIICEDNNLAEQHIETLDYNICYLRPENDLFPSKQAETIKQIVFKMNDGFDVVVHTHSPYILSQLNLLLKAGRLAEQFKDDEAKLKQIEAIIPRKYWLPREDVNVYKMEDGKNYQLIEEDGLINGEYLDGLSEKLMHDYDDLLEIEFKEGV